MLERLFTKRAPRVLALVLAVILSSRSAVSDQLAEQFVFPKEGVRAGAYRVDTERRSLQDTHDPLPHPFQQYVLESLSI